jgi:hypothetical protein
MLLSRLLCWGALVVALSPALALAATENPAPLRAELDAIYQRLLSDPSDRALNRRLIEIAMQLEDYDAAIGAVVNGGVKTGQMAAQKLASSAHRH